ncbi:EAL domain-containing protein, partial [Acinetobacter baumannii]
MSRRSSQQLALEADLRQALERGELVVHYQPRVRVAGGTARIVGCEALLRWQHPQRGLLSPGQFVGMAEETGLIVQIGLWVLETACRQNAAWHQAGLPPISVSVNV